MWTPVPTHQWLRCTCTHAHTPLALSLGSFSQKLKPAFASGNLYISFPFTYIFNVSHLCSENIYRLRASSVEGTKIQRNSSLMTTCRVCCLVLNLRKLPMLVSDYKWPFHTVKLNILDAYTYILWGLSQHRIFGKDTESHARLIFFNQF